MSLMPSLPAWFQPGKNRRARMAEKRGGAGKVSARGLGRPRVRADFRLEQFEPRVLLSALVMTDQQDYAPGATVNITGSGFGSSETVDLQVFNVTTNTSETAWSVTADPSGNVSTTATVGDWVGDALQLTATGESSGSAAATTFTDTPTITTDQAAYAPGSTASITGAGWQAGETVNLQVFNVTTDTTETSWSSAANSSGAVSTTLAVGNWSGDTLQLLATGATSGLTAQTTFTDVPTVVTDQTGYAPGTTANISGVGWVAGETVDLQVVDVTTSLIQASWNTPADSNGDISSAWTVPNLVGDQLQLTATGETSGLTGQTTFTDGPNLATDQAAYAPGSTASVKGAGWQAGETVNLQLVNVTTRTTEDTWSVAANSSGAVSTTVTAGDWVGDTLQVTATGATSGWTAAATFLGGSTIAVKPTDDPPGSTASIAGAGWQAGETVELQVFNVTTGINETSWTVQANSGGSVFTTLTVGNWSGDTLQLTATGESSGDVATTDFTDSNHIDSVVVGAQSPNPVISGSSATYPISFTSNGSGADSVTLSVISGLPTGATASFNPNPVDVNGTATLTIATTSSTPAGTYTFTVKAVADATVMANGTLVVAPTFTWTGGGSPNSNWSDGANWQGGVAPTSGGTTVLVFPSSASEQTNTDNISGLSIAEIEYTETTGTAAYNTSPGSGDTITLSGSSGLGIEDQASGTNTFSVAITLGNSLTIQANNASATLTLPGAINNAGNPLTFDVPLGFISVSGVISGTGGLAKTGANQLSLGNTANTYTGQTTISAGGLNVSALATGGNPSSLGAASGANATILLGSSASATLGLLFSGTSSTDRPITINGAGGGIITLQDSGSVANLSGGVNTNGNSVDFSVFSGTQINESGIISGAGSLTGGGGGTLVLSNTASSYTGPTSFGTGTLSVAAVAPGGSNSSLGAASGANATIQIGGGTLSYTGGAASTDRPITLSNFQTVQNKGSGTLTLSGGVSNAGDTLTIDANTGNITESGVISGLGALSKIGVDTLTLSGANIYTGTTNISAGTLLVNGSLASGSAVSVSSGATLGGGTTTTSGTVSGTVSDSGIISPGASYGSTGTASLNTGNVTFNSGSAFDVDLNGTNESSGNDQYDQLNVTGTAALGTGVPTLNVSVASGFAPAVGNSFTIITASTSVTGTFSGLPSGTDFLASTGQLFQITYTAKTAVLTRIQAALTVTPDAVSTTYSGVALNNTTYSDNTSNYSITGFVLGQTIASAGVTLSGSMAFNGSTVLNAGTYTQAVGTLVLSSTGSNYSMTFSNPTPNDYVITPKALTYSGLTVPASMVYNGTTTVVVSGTAALLAAEAPGTGTTSDDKPYNGDTVTLTGTATGTYNSKDVATATTVTFAGLSSSNSDYTVTPASTQAATITAKALTYSGPTVPSSKVYDGTTTAVVGGTAAALQAAESTGTGSTADDKPYTGDTVSATGTATASYNTKDVTTANLVTFAGVSLTGAQSGDYTLTGLTQAATITPKALSYSGPTVPSSKVYDGTTMAVVGGTAAALQAAESTGTGSTADDKPYTGDTVSATGTATASYNTKDVTTANLVTFGGLSLTGTGNGDYTLTASTQAATITPKALTYGGLSVPSSKVYDGTTMAVVGGTAAALQLAESTGTGSTADDKPYSGDTVSATGTATATYTTKDVATANLVTFAGVSLTGAQSGDYTLTGLTQAATIAPKALSYSGPTVPSSKVYDGTTTAVVGGTAAALQAAESTGTGSTADDKPYSGDTVSATGTATASYNTKDVTTANLVTFAGVSLTGAQSIDYTLTTLTQAATITPETVTALIIGDPTKTYDGNTSAALTSANFSLSGLVGSESFTVTQTAGTYNSKDAATANMVTASLSAGSFTPGSGTLAGDYTLPTAASGAGTITAATVTVAAAPDTKSYDSTTASAVTPTFQVTSFNTDLGESELAANKLYNSDAFASLTQTFNAANAGSHTLTVATDNFGSNYTVVGTPATASGTINAATVTVVAVSDTKSYDSTTASSKTPTFQVTSFNTDLGESEMGANTLYRSDSFTTLSESFDSANAGARTLTASYTISPNYTVTSAITAAGTITPATVTIAAVTDTKSYDSTTASSKTPTFQVTSFNTDLGESELAASTLYNSDSFTTLSESFDSANAGARTLTASYTISPNYTVTSAATASGAITPATVTIAAVTDTKSYDSTTASSKTPTFQVTSFNTDLGESELAASTLYNSDSFTTLSESFDSANAGARILTASYTISPNYTVTSAATASGTITPATVTIAAVTDTKSYDSTTASSKTPTFQVTSFNTDLGESELGANTLYNSDCFTTLSESFDSANAGARTLTASYTISPNYTVTSAATASGAITPATVTIAAVTDASRMTARPPPRRRRPSRSPASIRTWARPS